MNRRQRRALERQLAGAASSLTHAVPASVALAGGPMDGWVVKPNAPVLRADWHTTWPASIAATNRPGRYDTPAVVDGVTRASWLTRD